MEILKSVKENDSPDPDDRYTFTISEEHGY